jgi:hypothetical protein
MRIIRLDRRYTGANEFKYCIEFAHPHKDGDEFCEVREWCWQTWGPGRELKFLHPYREYIWAFFTDTNRTRIYLNGDKELEWYKLRWE